MTFQQINCIIEIMRCGSISNAAKNLFVAQPYLSSIVKDLETEIGIQIFLRSNRGTELTDDGKEFIGYVRPLLEQKNKILEMYTCHKAESFFRFNISLQRFPFVVESFMEIFNEKKPDKYECHIREVGMYRVISDVFNKKSDLGIIYISDVTERFIKRTLSSKGLEFLEIAVLTPYVYLRSQHPLAVQNQVDLLELQEYPFISFDEESYVSLDFSEEVILNGFSPSHKRIFVEDRATMYNLLSYTDGYSIGTGILPSGYSFGTLVSRPILQHDNEVKLGYIKLASQMIDDNLLELIDRIGKNVSEYRQQL